MVIKEVEQFRLFMNNLTELTGKNINTTYTMWNLYHTFVSETSMGLTIPKWAEEIFPNGKLFDAAVIEYRHANYNKKLRRLYGGKCIFIINLHNFFQQVFFFFLQIAIDFYIIAGMLLRNILETMTGIANGTINNGRKINLFSGHETNIAAVLLALDVYKPHVPKYSSAIIFELYTDNNDYFVKVI